MPPIDSVLRFVHSTVVTEFGCTDDRAGNGPQVDVLPLNEDWFVTTDMWDADDVGMYEGKFELKVTPLVCSKLEGSVAAHLAKLREHRVALKRRIVRHVNYVFPSLAPTITHLNSRGGTLAKSGYALVLLAVPFVQEHRHCWPNNDIELDYYVRCTVRLYKMNFMEQ